MLLQRDPLSQEKPPNLPPMEIIKSKPNSSISNMKMQEGRTIDFSPSYVRPTSSKVRPDFPFLFKQENWSFL